MFGLQEILIISAIIVGAIFIPRMATPRKPAPRLVRPPKKLSGRGRLAVVVSIVFPLAIGAIMKPWQKDPVTFLYIGVGPVLLGWLLYWVLQGFRRP